VIPEISKLLPVIINSIKKISDNDLKSLSYAVANICVRDREVCMKIMKIGLTVYNTARYVLRGAESGGGRGEEEEG
jgi:hypothetical protein